LSGTEDVDVIVCPSCGGRVFSIIDYIEKYSMIDFNEVDESLRFSTEEEYSEIERNLWICDTCNSILPDSIQHKLDQIWMNAHDRKVIYGERY
jgi:hypothetical protein